MDPLDNHLRHRSQQHFEQFQFFQHGRAPMINLDNDVTLPLPNEEQKIRHNRQKSINKKKRHSIYLDYPDSVDTDSGTRLKLHSFTSHGGSQGDFQHCRPVHTQFRSSILKSFDIEGEIDDVDESDDLTEVSKASSLAKVPQRKLLSFIGLRNLLFLILLLNNCQLGLYYLNKLSLQMCIRYFHIFIQNEDWIYGMIAIMSSMLCLTVSFAVEKMAASAVSPSSKLHRVIRLTQNTNKDTTKLSLAGDLAKLSQRSSSICFVVSLINIMSYLLFTNLMVYKLVYNSFIGFCIIFHSLILSFKLTSYYFTNKELRELFLKSSQQKSLASSTTFLTDDSSRDLPSTFLPLFYNSCQYPRNVTYANVCQFWFLPTLIYQAVYPMHLERKTNWKYIIYKSVEIVTATCVIIYLNNYYALPIFQKLLTLLFEVGNVSLTRSLKIFEFFSSLSMISILMWLLIYYSFFHNFLNILAELTKFGDRDFYYNWWNADSILKNWSRWNKPLNIFVKRHVMANHSNKKFVKVFIVGAILAEMLIAVPTHNILGLALLVILLQIPLIYITELLNPGSSEDQNVNFTGNCLFWCSFLISHPFCFLFYYLSWCAKNDYVDDYKFRK